MKKKTKKFKVNLNSFGVLQFFEKINDKNIFLDWYDSQSSASKVGFYGAMVIAFISHAIVYINHMLEEHLPGYFLLRRDPPGSGRWFHYEAHRLSFYYMNWVSGLLQVVFLALTVFIIIKAFNVQNRLHALLIAGVVVSFPTIAESNIYAQQIAPISLATFLSVAAFYITKLYKFGWIIGAFLVMLGLATFQSKISFAMMASLIHLFIYVINENPKFVKVIKYSLRYLLLIVCGLAFYYISVQILDIPLDRRGMGGISLVGIHNHILRAYAEVFYYFFSNSFWIDSCLIILAYGYIATMAFLLFVLAIKDSVYKKRSFLNVIIAVLLVLLMPLAANFARIFDLPGAVSIMGMTGFAFTLLVIFPVLMLENIKFNMKIFGIFGKLTVIAIVFIIGFNVSFSNFIYQRGYAMHTRVMFLANRLASHIEPLLPYSERNQVFLTGNIVNNPLYPHMSDFTEFTPPRAQGNRMFGFDAIGVWPDRFLPNVIRYRIGLNIRHVGLERRSDLLEQAISYGMPVYPLEGSVALVDGVVVVMLNFYGRIDIEDIYTNYFTATANHTGKSTDLEFVYTWFLYSNRARLREIAPPSYSSSIDYAITQPGSYQFRVFIRLADGRNVINFLSPAFEVE